MIHDGVAIVTENTCGQAWEESVRMLLESDSVHRYLSAEGPCWEIRNLIMVVNDPELEPRVSAAYDFGEQILDYSAELALKPSARLDTIYERMFRWRVGRRRLDQIEKVTDTLRKSPSSRRAVAAIWDPSRDTVTPHPMAPLNVVFRIQDSELWMTLLTRSNDAWFAAPADLKIFTDLQIETAAHLGVSVGKYIHHSISYHIYDFDVPRALKTLGKSAEDLSWKDCA